MQPLNLNESSAQILFDIINASNQTNLLPSQFTLGTPTLVDPINQPALTSITLTPVFIGLGSNPVLIQYNRINISDIFSAKTVQVLALTEVNLSDIIAEINTDYGTNLTITDFIDTVLPVINPLIPNAPRYVTIVANPTSIMYYGTFIFQLGPRTLPVPASGNVVFINYIFNPGVTVSNYTDVILAYNVDNSINTSFKCLSNITAISAFEADTMLQTSNGDLMLLGNFAFTYTDITETSVSVVGVASIILNTQGSVVSTSSVRLNNPNEGITYVDNGSGSYSYITYVVPQQFNLAISGSGIPAAQQAAATYSAAAQTASSEATTAATTILNALATINAIQANITAQAATIAASLATIVGISERISGNLAAVQTVSNATPNNFIFGQAVYYTSPTTVDLGIATDPLKKNIMGLINSSTISGNGGSGTILTFGEITGTVEQWSLVTEEVNGLTPDAEYFLDISSGKITSAAPLTIALYLCPIGIAVTNTTLIIKIENPILL